MSETTSNTTMTRALNLKSQHRKLHEAFLKVDRRSYVSASARNNNPQSVFYEDRAIRFGFQAMKAPSLYAEALVALELEGDIPLRVLSVGSATAYFQALVANILPKDSLIHGIDFSPTMCKNARKSFERLNNANEVPTTKFFEGNVFDIDFDRNIQYDRIFIATELCETYAMSGVHTFFMSMIRSNGIIVYPYTNDDDELLVHKLVKQTEPSFPILRCTDVVLHSGKSRRSNDKIILQPGVWEAKLNVHQEYCDQFKRAALCLMLVHRFGVSKIIACCVHPSPTSSPSSLPSSSSHISSQYQFKFSAVELIPAELWQLILQFCSRSWFITQLEEIQYMKNQLEEERVNNRIMIQQMGCIMATKMHQEAVDHAMASSFMSFLFNHMDSDEDDGDDEYQDTCT